MKPAIPTDMGGQVDISVRDDEQSPPPPQPPLFAAASNKLGIATYTLLLVRTIIICVFGAMRTYRKYENKNQPAFESNRVFKIICIVALSAIGVLEVVLWCPTICLQPYMSVIYYTILNSIGGLSMFLAPFSFMMVLVLPPKLNWIAYLVVCVMSAIVVTCFYLDDQQREKRPSTFYYLVVFLVPFLIALAFVLPENLNRIVYPMIYLSLGIEIAYHVIAYLLFIYIKTTKRRNMEAH